MKIKFFIILIIASGCYHKSELKHEKGIVIEKQYFPDTNQTVTGTGFSSNGSLIITTHQIGEDEKYIVIFKCEHGVVFSVNKSMVYGKLEKGDNVEIDYYELLNDDDEIKDLYFVNANKKL
jgi:hypothetical protein